MVIAQVLTEWAASEDGHSPKINLRPGDSAMDVTGQANVMPDPNLVVWELWCADIAPYEADSSIDVLWWEEQPEELI